MTEQLLGKEWRRDDGAMMRIERCLIDANWGQSTDVVYQFCRQSRFAPILLPRHAKYVGASSIDLARSGDIEDLGTRSILFGTGIVSGRRRYVAPILNEGGSFF